jgi:hypothetical protein
MNGLKIDFSSAGGPKLDLASSIEGAYTSVQNALVNIATSQGSDSIFEDRGTNLLAQALQGRLVNLQAAQVASNFAAVDTTYFLATTETSQIPAERIQRIGLAPVVFNTNSLQLDAIFDMEDGTVIGVEALL